ncbi:MAG: hypothetical protein IPK70_17515 [Flavobacteriales bacterium]|nr:hypothetical protein [Flavobacteriales bacterium]
MRLGIPKADDPDGSSVGGANNDGGSAAIPGGLLVNGTPEMGIVLTTSDGLVPLGGQPAVPPSFLVSGDDLDAVFRDETTAGEFVSNDSRIVRAPPRACREQHRTTSCSSLSSPPRAGWSSG